jgi:DNA-binding transcriptional ArsR family regulator
MYAKRRRAAAPDRLSAIFGALADPTRRAMLERLRTGVCSVTDLAEPFQMAQPTISQHLKVLERAGLVVCARNAQWRPRGLKAAPLQEANAPLQEANMYLERFRALWDDRLDRMELYLNELQADQ